MTEPDVVVTEDLDALASGAARRIATALTTAVSTQGVAHWATTGGSTAPAIYRQLAARPLRDAVPWESVHVWWGDDRFVPRDHPLSNVKPFNDILMAIGYTEEGRVGMGATSGELVPVGLPPDHVHPFPTTEAIGNGRGAAWCASQLAGDLRTAGLDEIDGWPVFDLVVVGVGRDGHLLSVFPGSAAVESRDLAMVVPAPTHIEPHVERLTLNPAILGVAREILVVVTGRDKAPIVAEILGPNLDPGRLPAQLARREGVTWLIDAAAAASLRR